jgi:hypothetical protein
VQIFLLHYVDSVYSDVVHPRIAGGDRLQIYFIITLREQKRGGAPKWELGNVLRSTYHEQGNVSKRYAGMGLKGFFRNTTAMEHGD